MWNGETQTRAERSFQGICCEDFPSASALWTERVAQVTPLNRLDFIWLRDEFHSQQCNSRTNLPLYNPSFSQTCTRSVSFTGVLGGQFAVRLESAVLSLRSPLSAPRFPWAASEGGGLCSSGAFPPSQRGEGEAKENSLQFKAFCFAGFNNRSLTWQILLKIVIIFFFFFFPPSSRNVLP